MLDRRLRRIAIALALVALTALANAQVQLPSSAATDCLPHGGTYAVLQHVPLSDVASGRDRYGPCFGGNWQLAGCDDNQVGPGGAKRCITTEAERQQIIEWSVWQQVGCTLEPGESVSMPSEQEIEDAGLVIGLAAKLQGQRRAACGPAEPPPTPTPTQTPTPGPTPDPTPAPTPEPTPDPTPEPTPSAPACVPQPLPEVVLEALRAIPDRGWLKVTWQLPSLRDRALEALATYEPCVVEDAGATEP